MSKKIGVLIVLIFLIIMAAVFILRNSRHITDEASYKFNLPRIMQLQSSAFGNNQSIPAKYTCDDGNVNPPLQISEVPAAAKSLVLIVGDPDAASGNWSHWLVWNIDPTTREITENSVPIGASEGRTDSGKPGYDGPCPPSGTHRYFFILSALDTVLDLSSDADKTDLEKAMDGHTIDQATLIGLYAKK
jgi:Raf kinase inhibitor-like YbhB/YbcL family protein